MLRGPYKNILIIGGSSGLGLALARRFQFRTCQVTVTGRTDPHAAGIRFLTLSIGGDARALRRRLHRLLADLPAIDMLIYAAGFFQTGTIRALTAADIEKMISVGLLAPALLIRAILKRQRLIPALVAITSTSQWIPRRDEPVYAAVKAGLSMLAHSLSLDPRIRKVLVVGPAGMDTKFWKGKKRTGSLLDPQWVASEIESHVNRRFSFRLIRILRNPPRTQVVPG